MAILTQAHREHFDAYGYMVIENAVPTELCNAVVDAISAIKFHIETFGTKVYEQT